MKLPQINEKWPWNYLALAFGIPTGLMLVLMFVTSAAPFGDYSMLYSDMFHQYYPFFKAFREHLRSGESLLWDWSAGMGMDYLGLISYYLASPLNLLSVLVPDGWELGYFGLLMPVKLGLASLSFAYMLKKLFDRNDLSISLFGALYGMCAWALGYQWNVMWLDTFALVPLVALGTVLLLRDKKYLLYTLSLFLAIFANYYVGFFVCIFVFLLFFCYEICRFKSVGRFLLDFVRIGFFSVLAIGMTAVLELPALAALQNTQSSVNNFPEGFQINLISGEAVDAAKEAWSLFKVAREAGGDRQWILLWEALKASFGPMTQAMILVSGQMGGGKTFTYMDGAPNLYCGVLPIALGFLFLLAKDVKLRDKLCCVFLLVFLMLSIIIRQLDYIWHGFHFTNQIPYRFSFLFSFVLLYMAYRAWLLRDRVKLWQIITAGVLSMALLLLYKENRQDVAYLAFNFAFLGLYFGAMLFGHKDLIREPAEEAPEASMPELENAEEELLPAPEPEMAEEAELELLPMPEAEEQSDWRCYIPCLEVRQRISALAVAAVILLELVLNIVAFGATFGIYDYDYPKNGDATASMLQVMRDQENGESLFYRVETTHAQTLNDGPLNGYYGISTFTSSANVRVTKMMKGLGYGAWDTYNRYCYEDGSPVSNLFLNIKYMVEREFEVGENAYFDVLHTYDKVTLLENNAYLPLGFLAQPKLAEINFSSGSNFQIQNKVFSAATGLAGEVWSMVDSRDVKVVAENVTLKIENMSGYTSYTADSSGGKLMYEYTITKDGFMGIDVNLYSGKNFTVWHNGKRLYSESYSLPQLFAVGSVKEGDKVQVVVECKASEESSISIRAGIMDDVQFREGYEILKASTLELTEFSSTYLAGTIDCNRDGLLYTSIPQDGNWKAIVDGREVETTLVGDAMLALHLTEGKHTLEFRYENRAFEIGLLVSLGCAAVLGGIVLAEYWIKKKRA